MHLPRCNYAAVVMHSSFLFGGKGGGVLPRLGLHRGHQIRLHHTRERKEQRNLWKRSEVGVGRMHCHTHTPTGEQARAHTIEKRGASIRRPLQRPEAHAGKTTTPPKRTRRSLEKDEAHSFARRRTHTNARLQMRHTRRQEILFKKRSAKIAELASIVVYIALKRS